jgi:hypothetical protein
VATVANVLQIEASGDPSGYAICGHSSARGSKWIGLRPLANQDDKPRVQAWPLVLPLNRLLACKSSHQSYHDPESSDIWNKDYPRELSLFPPRCREQPSCLFYLCAIPSLARAPPPLFPSSLQRTFLPALSPITMPNFCHVTNFPSASPRPQSKYLIPTRRQWENSAHSVFSNLRIPG